jgi:hypothetical protein
VVFYCVRSKEVVNPRPPRIFLTLQSVCVLYRYPKAFGAQSGTLAARTRSIVKAAGLLDPPASAGGLDGRERAEGAVGAEAAVGGADGAEEEGGSDGGGGGGGDAKYARQRARRGCTS